MAKKLTPELMTKLEENSNLLSQKGASQDEIQQMAYAFVEQFGVDDSLDKKKSGATPLVGTSLPTSDSSTPPVSPLLFTSALNSQFNQMSFRGDVPEQPQYSKKEKIDAFKKAYKNQPFAPSVSDNDLESIAESSVSNAPKLSNSLTEKVKQKEAWDNFIAVAPASRIIEERQKLVLQNPNNINEIAQSRLGKTADYLDGITKGNDIDPEDLKYLKEVAPKASNELIPEGIDLQTSINNNREKYQEQQAKDAVAYSEAQRNLLLKLNVVSPSNPIDISDGNVVSSLSQKQELQKENELKAIELKYPKKTVGYPNYGNDFQTTTEERPQSYYNEVLKLNEKYNAINSSLGAVHATAIAIKSKDDIIAGKKSLDYVGEESLKYQNSSTYKLFKGGGSQSEEVKATITKLGIEAFRQSGISELNKIANTEESSFYKKYPKQLDDETLKRLSQEYFKQTGLSYAYNQQNVDVSALDKIANNLPSIYKQNYYNRLRKEAVDKNKKWGDMSPSEDTPRIKLMNPQGAINQLVNEFVLTTKAPINGVIKLFTSKEKIANEVLSGIDIHDQAVFDEEQSKATIEALNEKIKTKPLTYEELNQYNDARSTISNIPNDKFLGIIPVSYNFVNKAAGTVGMVASIAMQSYMMGGVANSISGTVGGATVEGLSILQKTNATALEIEKYVSVLNKIQGTSGALTMGVNMMGEQIKRSVELMPDDNQTVQRGIYTALMTSAWALASRIMPLEKVFSKITPNVEQQLVNLAEGISEKKISEELAKTTLQKIMENAGLYVKDVATNTAKVTAEMGGIEAFKQYGVESWADKNWNAEHANEAIKHVLVNTPLDMLVVNVIGGAARWGNSRPYDVKNIAALGDKETGDRFIDIINAQRDKGNISEEVAIKRIKIVSTLQDINKTEMPKVMGIKKLTQNEQDIYSIQLLNEKILSNAIENTTDKVLINKYIDKISESQDIRDKILGREVVVTPDYNIITVDEANNQVKNEQEKVNQTPTAESVQGEYVYSYDGVEYVDYGDYMTIGNTDKVVTLNKRNEIILNGELVKNTKTAPSETASIEKPSMEKQLEDVNAGRTASFTYNNESEVPEIFKDKISSSGEKNGVPFVKVTVAQSLADYELNKNKKSEPTNNTPALKDVESTTKALQEIAKNRIPFTFTSIDEFGNTKTIELNKGISEDNNGFKVRDEEGGSYISIKNIAEAYHKAKVDGSNPELVKAVEQSLKETPQTGSVVVGGDVKVQEPKAYAEATNAYKATELGSSEDAKNKKQALVEQAETKEGKEFVENQVAQLEKNDDGTITVFRSGTMQDGHNPATTSRKMAEIIASERKKQGLSSDIIEVRVNPSDISVVVKGIENEVFVKVDKTNKERIDKNTIKKQKTKAELLTERGEVQKELEKTKKALSDSEKAFNDGTYPFSENVFKDANKKQKAKIKNLEWQLSKIDEAGSIDVDTNQKDLETKAKIDEYIVKNESSLVDELTPKQNLDYERAKDKSEYLLSIPKVKEIIDKEVGSGNKTSIETKNEPITEQPKQEEELPIVKIPITERKGETLTVNVGGKAITGIVEVDEGGKATITSGNKIIELRPDQPYVDYESPVRLADNIDGIQVNGEVYSEVRFDKDEKGNERAVLVKEDGSIKLNSTPSVIEELKYQSALHTMEQLSEQEAEQILKQNERKGKTTQTTQEGVSKTDGTTPTKSEQEIRLQEAVDEINLIEQTALEDLKNVEIKAKLIQYENNKTYLVEKKEDGTYEATLNGRRVRKGNHLNNLIKKYESQTKAESDALIPKLQKQVNELKKEVENKLFGEEKKIVNDKVKSKLEQFKKNHSGKFQVDISNAEEPKKPSKTKKDGTSNKNYQKELDKYKVEKALYDQDVEALRQANEEVKGVFDRAAIEDNNTQNRPVTMTEPQDADVPKQKIEVSPTDTRPEATLMGKLRIEMSDWLRGEKVGLGMSDPLRTGDRKVAELDANGNPIEKTIRDEGGIGYPFKSLNDLIDGTLKTGQKIYGWAAVKAGAASAMLNAAKSAKKISGKELKAHYFENLNLTDEQKQRIENAIPNNKEFGLVTIYKMGEDGIKSNEAFAKEAFRLMDVNLTADEKSKVFEIIHGANGVKGRLETIKWGEEKDKNTGVSPKEKYLPLLLKAKNFTELEAILNGDKSDMSLGTKSEIMNMVFLSSEGTASSEKVNPLAKILKDKGINTEGISKTLSEPIMDGIDAGQPMILLAIDPNSKVIEDVNRERHPNYAFGVEGFPIGLYSETSQMHHLSPEMMDTYVKTSTTSVDENVKVKGTKETSRISISHDSSGNYTAELGKGATKLQFTDKKGVFTKTDGKFYNANGGSIKESGNVLTFNSKEAVIQELKKQGYVVSEASKEPYTQNISGSNTANLMQKAKVGIINFFKNPQITAQQKLVIWVNKAFPNIDVIIDKVAYAEKDKDLKNQKLLNKNDKTFGVVDGETGKIYLNPEFLNNNTPIHEMGHVWNQYAKKYNPKIYKKGIDLIIDTNNSRYYDKVINNLKYRKLSEQIYGDDAFIIDKATGKYKVNESHSDSNAIKESIADEALAKAIGDKGELFVNEAQKRNFVKYITELYNAMKGVLGFGNMSAEKFQNLTLGDFTNSVLKDLLSGKEVSKLSSKELAEMSNSAHKFDVVGDLGKDMSSDMNDIVKDLRDEGKNDKEIREIIKFELGDSDAIIKVLEQSLKATTQEGSGVGDVKSNEEIPINWNKKVIEYQELPEELLNIDHEKGDVLGFDYGKHKSKIETVNIKELIPTQPNVYKHFDKTLLNKQQRDIKQPIVIIFKGNKYLMDGHHKTQNAINNGENTIKVEVYNLDNLEAVEQSLPTQAEAAAGGVVSDYGNFLLNEIDKKHQEKYKGENIKEGLAKLFNETLNDRDEKRAISNLEDTYMNYVPMEVRAEAYQALRKNFEKEQSLPTQEVKDKVVGSGVGGDVKDYKGIFNPKKTGISGLDVLLKDDGYNYFYKGVSGEVVMMSPDQYLKKVREGLKTKEDANIIEDKKNKINEAINDGNKIDMPFISTKDGKFSQEGRNRAVVAREKGEKLIPVFIEKDVSFDDKIAKGQEYINSAIKDGATTKEEVISKLEKQGLHRDAIRFIDNNFDNKAVEQSLTEVPKSKQQLSEEEKGSGVGGDVKLQKGEKLIYHHTQNDLSNIKSRPEGTWFTTNEYSPMGARAKGKNIISKIINIDKLKLATDKEYFPLLKYSEKERAEKLIEQGFDGVKRKVDGDTHYLIFDLDKLQEQSIAETPKSKQQLSDEENSGAKGDVDADLANVIKTRLREEGIGQEERNKLTGTRENPIITSATKADYEALLKSYKNNKQKQLADFEEGGKEEGKFISEKGVFISSDTSFWDNKIKAVEQSIAETPKSKQQLSEEEKISGVKFGTAFDIQDATAERTISTKSLWGEAQVWRERIENAGDILRELSSRGDRPDIGYLMEKVKKLRDWITKSKEGYTPIHKSIKTIEEFEKTNLKWSDAVDSREYIEKFNSSILDRIRSEYEAIPTYTKEQKLAVDLVLDLINNNIKGLESKLNEIETIANQIKTNGTLPIITDIKLGKSTETLKEANGDVIDVKSNKDISKVFNRLLKDEHETDDYGIYGLLADWGAEYNPNTEKLEWIDTRSGTGKQTLSKKEFINDILNGKLEKEVPSAKEFIDKIKKSILDELGIKSETLKENSGGINANKDELKIEKEYITVYHGGEYGDKSGRIYVTEDANQGGEYAKGNGGDLIKYKIEKSKVASEKDFRKAIEEEGIVVNDELKLHELVDDRFNTALNEKEQSKIFDNLKRKGFDAASFTDEDITLRNKAGVENIVVFDAAILEKKSVQVREARAYDLLNGGYKPLINGEIKKYSTEEDISNHFKSNESIEMVSPTEQKKVENATKEQLKNNENEKEQLQPSRRIGEITPILTSAESKAESKSEIRLNQADKEADQVIVASGIKVATLPTESLIVEPKVFQYKASKNKSGTNENEQIQDKFDPNDAGAIGVWRDVDNELGKGKGEIYVVDGHHRTERAMKDNVENMNVFFIDAPTAKDAMVVAARTNIKQGKGTSVDAAKVIRENPELMKGLIAPNSKVAKEGLALSKLSDDMFEEVATGNMKMNTAIALSNVKKENQAKLRNSVAKYANNPNASQDKLNRFAVLTERSIGNENADVSVQQGMFGQEFELDTQAMAEVQSDIVSNLKDDARLLKSASRNADVLEQANSKVDTEATAKEGEKSKLAAALFDRSINEKGVREIFDKAVSDYRNAKGKTDKDAIIKKATEGIKKVIEKNISEEGERTQFATNAVGENKTTPNQQKQVEKITDFIQKGLNIKVFAPLSEFSSKLKEIGYGNVNEIKKPNGDVLGFYHNGKIYLNPDALTPETTWHELTHVQQQAIKIASDGGDVQATAILRRFDSILKEAIDQIESGQKVVRIGEQRIDLSSDVYRKEKGESPNEYRERVRNEMWAYLQAPINAKKFEEASGGKVKNFIQAVKKWFAEKLGLKDTTDLQSLTIEELLNRSSNSLAKGEYLKLKKQEQKAGEKTIMFNGEKVKVKPTAPDVVNGFYSPLEKTISETKLDKLPAKQWIEKFGKGDEAKWTGLSNWLAQQEGSVSKTDIQQYLKDNRIQVVELVKREGFEAVVKQYDGKNFDKEIIAGNENLKKGDWIVLDGDGNPTNIFANTKEEALKEAKELYEEEGYFSQTKYSQYQLEGEKENYKEVLVTLPNKEQPLIDEHNAIVRRREEIEAELGLDMPTESQKDEHYRLGWKLDDIRSKLPSTVEIRNSGIAEVPAKFKSSHFDEPNILVHLRMNTRTAADGSKVLFLEEVQTDWGQKGKKEGFDVKEFIVLDSKGVIDGYFGSEKEAKEYIIRQERLKNTANWTISKSKESIISSAPFVTDTNAWTKLGLKVALKEAVKQGADKIAWSTGEQQNERYDLSKQVKRIEINHLEDDTFDVTTTDLYGEEHKGLMRNEKELTDYVGKEIADKVINEGKSIFSGDGLKLGGKGMKGFYGSPTEGSLGIVGNVAKSLFKQEPKTVKINSGEKLGLSKPSKIEETQPNRFKSDRIYTVIDGNGNKLGVFTSYIEARRAKTTKDNEIKEVTSTQHSIDITPELKSQVESGLPLFTAVPKKELTSFIDELRGEGANDKEIESILKRKGNSQEEIDSALKIAEVPKVDATDEISETPQEKADSEYTHINKNDITVAEELAKKYNSTGNVVTWDESVKGAINSLANAAKKGQSLTDVAKNRISDWREKIENEIDEKGKSTFNPTDEDLAVMSYYRTHINEEIGKLNDRMSSLDDANRELALAQAKVLQAELLNVDKVLSETGKVAGRSFYIRQMVAKMDADNNLVIRRMNIIRNQGGKPLTEAQENAILKIASEHKKLIESATKELPKWSQEDFDTAVDEEVKRRAKDIKQTESKKTGREKTLSKSGKDIADRIRELKIDNSTLATDLTFGLRNLAVEAIAQLVEKGSTLAQAISEVLYKDARFSTLKEKEITDHIISGLDKNDILNKIKSYSDNNLSIEAVAKGLVNKLINHHIDNGVRGKDVFENVKEDLQSIYKGMTDQQIRDAYLKSGDYKLSTQKDINKEINDARNELRNIAKLETKIEKAKKNQVDARTEQEKRQATTEEDLLRNEFKTELNKRNIRIDRSPKDERDVKKRIAEEHNSRIDKLINLVDEKLKDNSLSSSSIKDLQNFKTNIELSKVDIETSQRIEDVLDKSLKKLRVSSLDVTQFEDILKSSSNNIWQLERDMKNAEQDILLIRHKKNLVNRGKEAQRKIDAEEFTDSPQPVRKKTDSEVVKLEIEAKKIEAKYRREQQLAESQNKKWYEKAGSMAGTIYIQGLIGHLTTAAAVGFSGLTKQPLNTITNATFGNVAHILNPTLSLYAGSEAPFSWRQEAHRYKAHYFNIGEEGMRKMWEKTQVKLDVSLLRLKDAKDALDASPNDKKLQNNFNFSKTIAQNALLDHQSNNLYNWIGGKSFKDGMDAMIKGANQLDALLGNDVQVSWKDRTTFEKWELGISLMGGLHGFLKSFSARAEFAAAYTARLEQKARRGDDISNPDVILSSINESYVNFLRGKYQEDNYVTSKMNEITRILGYSEPASYSVDKSKKNTELGKIASAAFKTKYPIVRTPVNIAREAIVEYMLGAFTGGGRHLIENIKGARKGIEQGIPLKDAIKQHISEMPQEDIDLIFRCYRKGGLGLVIFALAAMGNMKFGGFQNEDDRNRKKGAMKQGELELFGVDLAKEGYAGKVAERMVEHSPAFYPALVAGNSIEVYKRRFVMGMEKGKEEGDNMSDEEFKSKVSTTAAGLALLSDIRAGLSMSVPLLNNNMGLPFVNPQLPYLGSISDVQQMTDGNREVDRSTWGNRAMNNFGLRWLVPDKQKK